MDPGIRGLLSGQMVIGALAGAHDAARLVLDEGVVHRLERTLRINHGVEVDIGVAKGPTANRVAAHADRSHGADSVEQLEKQGLRHLRVQVTNVQRSSGVSVHDCLFWFFFCADWGAGGGHGRGAARAANGGLRRENRGPLICAPAAL